MSDEDKSEPAPWWKRVAGKEDSGSTCRYCSSPLTPETTAAGSWDECNQCDGWAGEQHAQ